MSAERAYAWHSISMRCAPWWQALGVALCVACGSSEHTPNASDGPAGVGGSGGTGTGTAAGGGPGGLGADPSPSAIAQALAPLACQQLFGCCTSAEIARQFQNWPSVPTDVASCVATISPSLSFNTADSARLASSGQLKFQPQYADACLAALAAQSCTEWSPKVSSLGFGSPIAPCAAVLQGTVPVGGDCSGGSDELCESGNCLSLSATKYECGAAGKVGDACQGSTQVYVCRAGLTCTGPQSSTDWTCQPTPRDDFCDGM